MSTDVVIEARELSKKFGAVRALDRVSFKVHRGEVVGFLGPNGAGKSTTMRILTCYMSASSGTAKVGGYDVFENPLAVRRSLGYLPQRAPLYGDMSVWEYLRFVADVRELSPTVFKKRMKDVAEICGLASSLGKDIRNLSHGYRQRVGLAQALVHNPPILILDEPTSDLDPNEKAEVIRYIQEIGKERTVVLSTHNLAEVEAACARAIIVSKGRVVADGALDDVRARSGTVRYHVVIHEQRVRGNGASTPPTAEQVRDALGKLPGVSRVNETPTDDRAHAFSLLAPKGSDLRPDIFELVVQKGWLLLEMRRDVKKLEDVFKTLTRGDEIIERGRKVAGDLADDEEPEEPVDEAAEEADEPEGEEPEDDADDESEDDESEDDESEDDESEDDEPEDDENEASKGKKG